MMSTENELVIQHTKNLYEYSEVLSLVQKGLRRHEEELVMFFTFELIQSGFSRVLWHRLLVIAVEDVIFGNPAMICTLLQLFDEWERTKNDELTYLAMNYCLQHTTIRIASTASICVWSCDGYEQLLLNPLVKSHWAHLGQDIKCEKQSIMKHCFDAGLLLNLFNSALEANDEFGALFASHLIDMINVVEERTIRGGSRLNKKCAQVILSNFRSLPPILQPNLNHVSSCKRFIELPITICFCILLERTKQPLLKWILLSFLECLFRGEASRRYLIFCSILFSTRWSNLVHWPTSANAIKNSLLLMKPTNPSTPISTRIEKMLKQKSLYISIDKNWRTNEILRPYVIPDWVADKHTLRGSGCPTREALIYHCEKNNIDISHWDEEEFNKSHPLHTVPGGVEYFYEAGLILTQPFPHCPDTYHEQSYQQIMREIKRFGRKKAKYILAMQRRYKIFLPIYGKRNKIQTRGFPTDI